jgi:hypothetical protein
MRRAALAAVLLLLARASAATDVELRLESTVEYDDNVLSSSADELDDFSLTLSPRLRVLDETGELNWEVRYAPRYRHYVDLDELSDWDHEAYGKLVWRIDERTTLRVTDWYTDLSSFNRLLTEEVQQDGTIETGIDFPEQRSKDNSLDVTLSHHLTRRHFFELSASRNDTVYDAPSETETAVTTGTLSYYYIWDASDQVGWLLRATQQTVDNTATGGQELDTNYYNLSLQWTHLFDPTLTLSASGGPTWVEAELPVFPDPVPGQRAFPVIASPLGFVGPVIAASCPVDDGDFFIAATCQPIPLNFFPDTSFIFEFIDLPALESSPKTADDLTYFAVLALTKEWTNYSLTLRYLRDASNTSQVSGVIRDVVSLTANWEPTERWRLTLSTFYEVREQQTNARNPIVIVQGVDVQGVPGVGRAVGYRLVEVDRDLENERIFVSFYAEYTMTRHTSLFGTVFFSHEEQTLEPLPVRKTDRFGVWLGFRYTFPRYKLPI